MGSRPRSVSRQSLCCTAPYLAMAVDTADRSSGHAWVSQPSFPSRGQRRKDSQGHPTRQPKPRDSPQPFVGSHQPRRRPEDRCAEGTAGCRKTGQAHTCHLDPNGKGFMLLLPVGREETLTVPGEDRPTLAKFMEGPRCGKAGALGKPPPHRGSREAWARCAGSRACFWKHHHHHHCLSVPGGWLPPSLTHGSLPAHGHITHPQEQHQQQRDWT